jgi:hypothetical protein
MASMQQPDWLRRRHARCWLHRNGNLKSEYSSDLMHGQAGACPCIGYEIILIYSSEELALINHTEKAR